MRTAQRAKRIQALIRESRPDSGPGWSHFQHERLSTNESCCHPALLRRPPERRRDSTLKRTPPCRRNEDAATSRMSPFRRTSSGGPGNRSRKERESATPEQSQSPTRPRVRKKHRCRANVAHTRQSRPDSGLGFLVKVLRTCQVVPSSLGSGPPTLGHAPLRELRPSLSRAQGNFASRLPFRIFIGHTGPRNSAAHRDKSREWSVSKQKWNLC